MTPLSEQTQFLPVGANHIAYDDTGGEGPLIVALPGMGDLRSEYRLMRPLLRQAGYRVVTVDIRGFGETSARWDDFSARAVGRDALALIDHLGASTAVILGNSFAAGAALWAAHDAPERVSGLVLLGPIVRDTFVPLAARVALAMGFAGPWRVWFWTTYWNRLFPARKPVDQAEAKAALARNLREPGRMDALRTMIGLSKADTAAIVPHVHVPALIVMGAADPDFPDATAEADWLSLELGAHSMLVQGAGHYPHTEFPELVAPRVLAFLEGVGV